MPKARAKSKAKGKGKTTPRKRATRRRQPAKLGDSLQRRLQIEFADAVNRAEMYIAEPERLQELIAEATAKAKLLPRQQFSETWSHLQTMLRLARAYARAEYRDVPAAMLLQIVGALLYLVNPLDLLPDSIPGIGLLDDAFILSLTIRRTRRALEAFAAWEIRTG